MKYLTYALVLLVDCSACTTTPQTDASTPDGSPDAFVDALPESAPCTPAPRPSYVPTGWIPYDDYAPCSGLYVPTAATQLPPPIDWQTCETAAGVAGCRRMSSGAAADVAVDAGHVDILFSTNTYSGVADADGAFYTAILATQPTRYSPYVFVPPTFSPPRWILLVLENQQFNTGGYIAGTLDQVAPSTSGHWTGNQTGVVGDLGILRIGANTVISLLDFDSGTDIVDIHTPSLPMSFEWMFGLSVFWQGNAGRAGDVGRWTSDGGAIDFINYGLDPNHPAGDFGTDGTDMVWLEGHGDPTDAGPYTSVDYWTAPYVADPSKIQPRRLRSETTTAILGTPVAVGCGYAAYAPVGFVNGLRIIRLSDGWSWFLANVSAWDWNQALALTCSEVFVSVAIDGPINTLARVALSTLGAGMAPD